MVGNAGAKVSSLDGCPFRLREDRDGTTWPVVSEYSEDKE
jgi:hypothetical protein